MKGVIIQTERSPKLGVIQDMFRLIEMGQNVFIIQVFDPALIPSHPISIGNRKVVLFQNAES